MNSTDPEIDATTDAASDATTDAASETKGDTMRPKLIHNRWHPKGPGEVIVLDCRDSFVFNLVHRLFEAGARASVLRADEVTLDELKALEPRALILSPGPGHPKDAGVCIEAVRAFSGKIPILGICLGHQAIAEAFGANVLPNGTPFHGKSSAIDHSNTGIFEGLPAPLIVGRYHSLIVEQPLPISLKQTAHFGPLLMGLQHREHPTFGVQFHPESILTPEGLDIFKRFVSFIPERKKM